MEHINPIFDLLGNRLVEKDFVIFYYKSFLTPGVITQIGNTARPLTLKFPYGTRRRVYQKYEARGGAARQNAAIKYHWALHTASFVDPRMVIKTHPGQITHWHMEDPYWTIDSHEGAQKSQELLQELLRLTQ